jgi:hypothetical protein
MYPHLSFAEWSVLYVIIASFVIVVALGILSWTTICCCKRQEDGVVTWGGGGGRGKMNSLKSIWLHVTGFFP